jgi:hypothetical protein
MASLSRAKRIPKFSSLVRGPVRHYQTPEQQRAIVLDIAETYGLKVERHDHPVM